MPVESATNANRVEPVEEAESAIPLKQRMLRLWISSLAALSTSKAGEKATDIFGYTRGLIPGRPDDVVPLGAKRFPIEGHKGISQGYLWPKGEGTVLLVHGWGANSSSMYSFSRTLQAAGFRVATFDAPCHGVWPGKVTTMTDFKEAVKQAMISLGDVVGIVSHSLGSIASMGALSELGDSHKVAGMVMLAPPATLPAVINRWSRSYLNLSEKVEEAMCRELWGRNGVPVTHWNIPELGRAQSLPIKVIHDPQDDVVPFCESERIEREMPTAHLDKMPGLGHVRILSDAGVVARVGEFLAKEARREEVSVPA